MLGKMKELMEMKKQADRIKRELDSCVIESEEVSGINVSITGSQDLKSIVIDEKHISLQNKKHLERDILRSVNAAIKKSQKEAAKKMQSAMGGMPGM